MKSFHIVLWGAPLSGKTSTLSALASHYAPSSTSTVALQTVQKEGHVYDTLHFSSTSEQEETHFFLSALPTSLKASKLRQNLLQQSHIALFLWDLSRNYEKQTLASFQEFRSALKQLPHKILWICQFTKHDLQEKDQLSLAPLLQILPLSTPYLTTSPRNGDGILTTFRLLLRSLKIQDLARLSS
jgi:GTPase SAR1 family protein